MTMRATVEPVATPTIMPEDAAAHAIQQITDAMYSLLNQKIQEYEGGDRPPSPPAWLLQAFVLNETTRIHVRTLMRASPRLPVHESWEEIPNFVCQCGAPALRHPTLSHIWGCLKCGFTTASVAICFKRKDDNA